MSNSKDLETRSLDTLILDNIRGLTMNELRESCSSLVNQVLSKLEQSDFKDAHPIYSLYRDFLVAQFTKYSSDISSGRYDNYRDLLEKVYATAYKAYSENIYDSYMVDIDTYLKSKNKAQIQEDPDYLDDFLYMILEYFENGFDEIVDYIESMGKVMFISRQDLSNLILNIRAFKRKRGRVTSSSLEVSPDVLFMKENFSDFNLVSRSIYEGLFQIREYLVNIINKKFKGDLFANLLNASMLQDTQFELHYLKRLLEREREAA